RQNKPFFTTDEPYHIRIPQPTPFVVIVSISASIHLHRIHDRLHPSSLDPYFAYFDSQSSPPNRHPKPSIYKTDTLNCLFSVGGGWRMMTKRRRLGHLLSFPVTVSLFRNPTQSSDARNLKRGCLNYRNDGV
nr:hypothetical protein [Tanacetum cinerariifolium]